MIERGKKPLTLDLAEDMASLYGVSTETVIGATPVVARAVEGVTPRQSDDLDAVSPVAVEALDRRPAGASASTVGAAPREDSGSGERAQVALSPDQYRACSVDWFEGADAHSARRRDLRTAALARGLTQLQAEQVAIASHPPLDDALATFDFYRELQKLTDDFKRQSELGTDAGAPSVAGLALRLMHAAAERHGARRYAEALASVRSAQEAEPARRSWDRFDSSSLERRRPLEEFQDVVKHRRRLTFDERGTGSARRFDAYVTATCGEDVLAAGFDHQRGVVRAINLSSLPTPPHPAKGTDASFEVPSDAAIEEAKRSLGNLRPDEGSVRITLGTNAEATVTSIDPEQVPHPTENAKADADSTHQSLPVSIALTIGDHHLFLDRQIRSAGAIGFLLTDPETGEPARAGVRIAETNGLPDTVLLGEEQLPLAAAHRWLPEERRFSHESEPFDRARASNARLAIGGRSYDLDLRVARRSTEQWTVRAKLTPTEDARATSREVDMPPKPSIKGAPVLPTPLFKLDGRWNWRWTIRTGDTQVMLPRELFEMNGVDTETLTSVTLPDGLRLDLARTKHGTGFSLQRVGALRKASRGRPGDYVFIGADVDAMLTFHRVTKQLMGRVQSHLKMASLLCGLTDTHPTLPAVLWALGVVDESGTINDAIAICEQRSDGPLARELRAHASEAGLPPDLDEIFKAL